MRVWNITPSHQALVHSMKEHRAPVLCIRTVSDNSQCVSASADGSCIVWDLQRYVRILAFFEPTVFQACLYHPDESQILTCGSNHKISYWDAYDGSAIRVIDGGDAEMAALDINGDGVPDMATLRAAPPAAATSKEELRARLALLQGVYPAANVPRHIMKELNNFFVAATGGWSRLGDVWGDEAPSTAK